jgi:hypothetical protein
MSPATEIEPEVLVNEIAPPLPPAPPCALGVKPVAPPPPPPKARIELDAVVEMEPAAWIVIFPALPPELPTTLPELSPSAPAPEVFTVPVRTPALDERVLEFTICPLLMAPLVLNLTVVPLLAFGWAVTIVAKPFVLPLPPGPAPPVVIFPTWIVFAADAGLAPA